jgi:hypothetical protein
VPSEALGLSLEGAVSDAERAGDLAERGALGDALEERSQEPRGLQPVFAWESHAAFGQNGGCQPLDDGDTA